MRLRFLPWLLLTAGSPLSAAPFGTPLDDRALARERGGFDLGNGLQVNLAVVSDSQLDGQTVLRTIYTVQGNDAKLDVLVPDASGHLVAADPAQTSGVQVTSLKQGAQVRFTSAGTDITNLVGNAIGSIVNNRADDRTINVQTTVDLHVAGATAQNLGSALPRIDDLALSSAGLLTH